MAILLTASPASAAFIMNEFNGDLFGDTYSALFRIDDTADPDVFVATLTNTSPDDGFGEEPLIDLLALNTTAMFGIDFTIQNLSPSWDVVAGDEPGPPNTDFDIVASSDVPGNRLGIGDTLTFDIVALISGAIDFNTFLLAEEELGTGIGGGEESGQKAVSFQQLGEFGEDSDLLADNWDPPVVIEEVPEPNSLALMGSALLGAAPIARRRSRQRH